MVVVAAVVAELRIPPYSAPSHPHKIQVSRVRRQAGIATSLPAVRCTNRIPAGNCKPCNYSLRACDPHST